MTQSPFASIDKDTNSSIIGQKIYSS